MSSIRRASWPMKRSRSASKAPSTASACPSRLASPQPVAPSSVSTRTNSQRGGTKKVSIRPMFIASFPGQPRLVDVPPGGIVVADLAEFLDRHHQAHARRRQDVAPVGDQLLVRLADVADLAVGVEQAERVEIAVLLAKRGVP